MTTLLLRYALGVGACCLACTSCGPVPPEPEAGGGIGGTGSVKAVASGPITSWGSVYVSGTKYDTPNTIYCIDDDPCSPINNLKLGMIVLVNGTATEDYATRQDVHRTADTITFEETVEGVVQAVAPDGLSLIVLGQVVHVDQHTIIDSSIPEQSIGKLREAVDVVEVSGFVVADGHILATLIMMQNGLPHYEVQGTIRHHDAKARRFDIGALIVDYSLAETGQMPPTAPTTWDGLIVHVRGDQWTKSGTTPYSAKLTATRVKPIGLGVENSEDAEVEGFILEVTAPGEFVVNNLRVRTTESTIFEGGAILDLVVGARVTLRGSLVRGVLEADRVSFKDKLELESNVASIDPGRGTLTVSGFDGLMIYVDQMTAIRGVGNPRRIENLEVGDHLKIHARPIGGTGLRATEIERSGASAQVLFEGPVQSALEPMLVIVGTVIDTSSIPRFLAIDGTEIERQTFFQNLTVGRRVSLKGTSTGTAIMWVSARLIK